MTLIGIVESRKHTWRCACFVNILLCDITPCSVTLFDLCARVSPQRNEDQSNGSHVGEALYHRDYHVGHAQYKCENRVFYLVFYCFFFLPFQFAGLKIKNVPVLRYGAE